MLFADLVLILLVGVVLMAVGIFVNSELYESLLGPGFDPFAMILMIILLLGGGGLILLSVAKLFLP